MRISQAFVTFKQENGAAGVHFHRTEFVVHVFGHSLFYQNLQSVHVHESDCDGLGEYLAVAHTRSLSIFSSKFAAVSTYAQMIASIYLF